MDFFQHSALLAAGAVVLVHEILKVVPNSIAMKYPVVTNIVLSVIASIIAVWQGMVAHPHVWTDWVLLIGTVSVVAAIVYNQLVSKREVLRITPSTRTTPEVISPQSLKG